MLAWCAGEGIEISGSDSISNSEHCSKSRRFVHIAVKPSGFPARQPNDLRRLSALKWNTVPAIQEKKQFVVGALLGIRHNNTCLSGKGGPLLSSLFGYMKM